MIKIPLFPEYSVVIELIKILDGKSVQDFKNMWSRIWSLRGTPQNTVDWTNPNKWIDERLTGKDNEFANQIWIESHKRVNPRWTRGAQFLMNGYNLISDENGVYQLTEDGRTFISKQENAVTRSIDIKEGLAQVLRQLFFLNNGKRSDLLGEWMEYTKYKSNLKQDSVIKEYLRCRIVNLVDRGYVKRNANTYSITDKGIEYLSSIEQENPNPIIDKEAELNRNIERFNKEQKELLKDYLAKTTPYQFENIIKDLLSSMGYEDVKVTSPTNDKGIDVTGISQNGITTVKEVVQVKRNISSNITRPILDALRGSLHRFDAFQGTIITLSDFAKGARDAAYEKGAAPLTLINGNKLVDLLVENGVGINKKYANYYIVDEKYFEDSDDFA